MASSPSIDVYVKLPTGENRRYDLLPSDNVKTVCILIASDQQVEEVCVRLKYQGKYLNKSHTLTYLGVRAETILKVEILTPKVITVVALMNGGKSAVEHIMKNTDLVTKLKQKIADAEGVPQHRVILKNEGRHVNGVSLLEAGIVDESVVKVEIAEDKPKSTSKKGEYNDNPESESMELDQEEMCKILSSFENSGRNVEVVFSFDTTGSMYRCLEQVRRKLRECCTRLIRDIPTIRIGLIAHGDYCDQSKYVVRSLDLTSDVQRLVDFANNVPATGGGDTPECYEWSLRKAQQLDWSEDSAKALVVIGDCEPHPPSYTDQNIRWQDELDLLVGMGVKVYGVKALNDVNSKPFYEELSERSGGCYLELRHFDVITDMFLAVCYRESNDDQLGAFEEELEATGQMTEEKKAMFKQLEETVKPVKNSKRYVMVDWWDTTLDNQTPQYAYIEQTDKWIPFIGERVQSTISRSYEPSTSISTRYTGPTPATESTSWFACSTSRRKNTMRKKILRKKESCEIM